MLILLGVCFLFLLFLFCLPLLSYIVRLILVLSLCTLLLLLSLLALLWRSFPLPLRLFMLLLLLLFPLLPCLPLSLFILFLLILGRRFFLLLQQLRLLLLLPSLVFLLPPGFPTLWSSSSFATSSFSSSFPLSLSASWGPYLSLLPLVSSVFSAPVLLFPLPLLSTLLLFSHFLFLGLRFLSGSCIDYFGSIFLSHALVSFGCWLGFLLCLFSSSSCGCCC